jgi:hypothetical protein
MDGARAFYAFLGVVVSFTISSRTMAATYYDSDTDGVYVYVDVYDEALPSQVCSSRTVIDDRFAGIFATASAVYPNTAHVQSHAAFSNGSTYQWSREVIHYGQQRGGNCGVISDTTTIDDLVVGVSGTNYKYSFDSGTSCVYSVDCDQTPTCGAAQGYANITDKAHPCGAYWMQQFAHIHHSNGTTFCRPEGYIPPNYFSGRNPGREPCT